VAEGAFGCVACTKVYRSIMIADPFGCKKSASCGTHLVWELPRGFPSAQHVQARMLEDQVGVYTLRDKNIAGANHLENCDRYLLLGFASIAEIAIEGGIS